VSRAAGIPEDKLVDLNRWSESDAFSAVERLVLEYAESLTATPAIHRPDLHAALRQHFSEKQLVELT
jgi:alkylhydroperoxidase family enzyme